jgi:hypothetical protein
MISEVGMNGMNRRQVIKAGVVGLVGAAGVSLVGCSKKTLSYWAGVIISSLEQMLPILSTLVPSSADLIAKAIATAKALKTALDNGSENAIELLNQLLAPGGLFEQIAVIVAGVNGPQQTILSGILALAGIALNLIATALHQGAEGAPTALVAKVRAKHAVGSSTIETAAKSGRLTKALGALK